MRIYQVRPCLAFGLSLCLGPAIGKLAVAQGPAFAGKIRPAFMVSQLQGSRDDSTWETIVVTDSIDVPALTAALGLVTADTVPFPAARSIFIRSTRSQLERVAGNAMVRAIWVIPPDRANFYARILSRLLKASDELPKPTGINLSLDPQVDPATWPYDPEEPMLLAFRAAARRGHVTVVAAGNASDTNSLSPWCLSADVLCVGASNQSGTHVAPFSSRGVPGDPRRRPSVVANGIDLLTAHPKGAPKTPDDLAAERRIGFDTLVAPDKRDQYTVVSGTSFAAPQVTAIVAQLHFFLDGLEGEIRRQGASVDTMGFSVSYRTTTPSTDERVVGKARLVGRVKRVGDTLTVYYPAKRSPALIIQIVHDLAEPMPRNAAFEVGAGFVSFDRALTYFGQYGKANIDIDFLGVGRPPPPRPPSQHLTVTPDSRTRQ